MSKNYKDFTKTCIGGSDVAVLTLTGFSYDIGIFCELLHFGGDGEYSAYIVDEDTAIPDHYEPVVTFHEWVNVYDDHGMYDCISGDEIRFYRAGNYGCIIQVFGRR